MYFFEKVRERSPVISSIIKFQSGYIYPFVFAVICALSASFGKNVYIPCILILCILTAFAGLFSSDLRVFIVPAFMIYYSIGSDKPADFYANYYKERYYVVEGDNRFVPTFEHFSLVFFIACLCLLTSILIYKMICSRVFEKMFTNWGTLFCSIVLLSISLVLNGVSGGAWRIESILYGLLSALTLIICYCLFYTIIKSMENGILYMCVVLSATAFCVLLQVLLIFVQLNRYDIFIKPISSAHDIINRELFATSWGLVTIVAAVIACGIPAALYLARNKKWPLLCFLFALLFFGSSFLVNTRSAMIFGGLSLFVGTLCALSGKNKRKMRVIVAVVFLIALIALLVLFRMIPDGGKELIKNLTLTLRLDFSNGDTFWQKLLGSRYDIWVSGIKDFLRAPLFGVGFVSGDYALNRVYDNMYHNIVIEFMGSMGIVGILAFLFHIFVILKVLLRKFSANKLLLLCVPLSILGMSLFDNFFFYPNFIIIYAAFLACAELYSEYGESKLEEI